MLRFLSGITGDGKSSFATGLAWDELIETTRPIVTNMALRLYPWVNSKGVAYKGLLRTLEELYGDTFDAERRIIFIGQTVMPGVVGDQLLSMRRRAVKTDPDWLRIQAEVQHFYRCRPLIPDDKEAPTEVRWLGGVSPRDYAQAEDKNGLVYFKAPMLGADGLFHLDGSVYGGICAIIEEAHEYFPKEAWSIVGRETRSAASQNRRAGDDWWMISQDCENVAKPFRVQSRECYRMINHSYRSFGPIRQPDVFTYEVHLRTPPMPGDTPMRWGRVKYNRQAIWNCYDTSAGAGVSGTHADIGKRSKGLNWKWVPAMLLAFCMVFWLGVRGCTKAISDAIAFRRVGKMVAGMSVHTNRVPVIAPWVGTNQHVVELVRSVGRLAVERVNTNRVVGLLRMKGSGDTFVSLEDGSQFAAKQVVEDSRGLVIDGESFRWHVARRREKEK